MLFAPTAAKHDLTAPTTVGGLKKSNCGDVVAKKKHQAAALITNGLRRLNQEQTQKQRQHHNQQNQQQQQQKHREQSQEQQPQKVELTQSQQKQQQQQQKQKQHQQQPKPQQQVRDSCGHHNLHHNHVPNLIKSEQQQQQVNQQQQHQLPPQPQQQQNQQLTMNAMKKFDAKLVAYLAGENLKGCNDPTLEEQEAAQLTEELCPSKGSLTTAAAMSIMSPLADCRMYRERQLQLFKRIKGIQLQMEALTLHPEGTKRMELLQNDIRPIFTVECQLSHELIKTVERYDMFHVMQFESEKFHSLTQCTRFGQEAKRAVKLDLMGDDAINNNNDNNSQIDDKPELGRIHFTVWWREPGTCLNEMLGMGVLALEELYEASVLEQCKRIVIHRRKMHLANLYFKISLQTETTLDDGRETFTEITMTTLNDATYTSNAMDDIIDGVTLTPNVLDTEGDYLAAKHATSLNGRIHIEDTKIQ